LCREFPTIAAAGELVVVLPQKAHALESYLRKHPLPFPLLPDSDRSRSRDWGVYHPLGIDAFRTARPASFVVGGDGKLRYTFVGSNQFRSVAPETLVEELQAAAPARTRQGD
jgi:peroxiredoxin